MANGIRQPYGNQFPQPFGDVLPQPPELECPRLAEELQLLRQDLVADIRAMLDDVCQKDQQAMRATVRDMLVMDSLCESPREPPRKSRPDPDLQTKLLSAHALSAYAPETHDGSAPGDGGWSVHPELGTSQPDLGKITPNCQTDLLEQQDRRHAKISEQEDLCPNNDFNSDGELSTQSSKSKQDEKHKDPEMLQMLRGLTQRGAFAGLHSMSTSADIDEEEYDVEKFYRTTGLAQRLVRSERFSSLTLAVISVNAIYIGVDVDHNDADTLSDAPAVYQLCDHGFCTFFLLEILIRYFAFVRSRYAFADNWFRFDSLLVVMMVLETWALPLGGSSGLPTPPLRLLRLLRLSRLVRLMRNLPELLTLVKGMHMAARGVLSSLLLMVMLIYVFGIAIHMALKGADDILVNDRFGNLRITMWTLLMDGVFMDSTGIILLRLLRIGDVNMLLSVILFLCFILLSTMTVMNMLIGVLCEVVSAVAKNERDEAAIHLVKVSILALLKEFDGDGSGKISREELDQVMNNPSAIRALHAIKVDIGCLRQLQEMVFADPEIEVPIKTLMDLLLMYRGDLAPTVKHVVDLQSFSRWSLGISQQRLSATIKAHMVDMNHKIESLAASISRGRKRGHLADSTRPVAPIACGSRPEGFCLAPPQQGFLNSVDLTISEECCIVPSQHGICNSVDLAISPRSDASFEQV